MPELLQLQACPDKYSPAVTLGPASDVARIRIEVTGASVTCQFWRPDPRNPNGQPILDPQERTYSPNHIIRATKVSGVQFRNTVAGQIATVTAEISFLHDPDLNYESSGLFTAPAAVTQYQHNGVNVGSAEPVLNFADSGSLAWTLTDSPGVSMTVSFANGTTGAGAVVLANGPTFVTSPVTFPDGTAAAPSIVFAGDASSGFFQLATGRVGISAGGTLRAGFVNDATLGAVSVLGGSTLPTSNLHVKIGDNAWTSLNTATTLAGIFQSTAITATSNNNVIGLLIEPSIVTSPLASNYTGQFFGFYLNPVIGAMGTNTISDYTALGIVGTFLALGNAISTVRDLLLLAPTLTQPVTSWRRVEILPPTLGAGGSITTLTGIRIGDMTTTGATTAWGLQVDGALQPSYFAGSVMFGSTAQPTGATVQVTGNVLATSTIFSSGATAGIGYGAGAGGTVTQLTSKSTGVTLNKMSGQITMSNAALAANTRVQFTVTNSAVSGTDSIIIHKTGAVGTANSYLVNVDTVSAGSFVVTVWNYSAGSLSEAIVLQYTIVRGVGI